jgi:hypothetical protein
MLMAQGGSALSQWPYQLADQAAPLLQVHALLHLPDPLDPQLDGVACWATEKHLKTYDIVGTVGSQGRRVQHRSQLLRQPGFLFACVVGCACEPLCCAYQ